jgi:hypothetical protein
MLGQGTGSFEVLGPARAVSCPTCVGPADVRSRHVIVGRRGIQVFCSKECKERALSGETAVGSTPAEPEVVRRASAAHPMVMGGLIVGCLFASDTRPAQLPLPAPTAYVFVPPPPIVALPPAPPKPSPEEELRAQWTRALMKDAWVHPLRGPARRMPIRDSRVFGAERPGERPIECQNGHCGVDIGGELWGEQVLAAHDGIVDRVVRGPNEERGGLYVRLAHRDGTVFTQYFHLAAIPRWVEAGRAVRAGELIGLVGDTGVKNSGPHLHFTLSVKPPGEHERYIDPEPLIALWPLAIPDAAMPGPRLSVAEAPGAVRGALTRRARPAAARRAERRTAAAVVEETEPETEVVVESGEPASPL